MMKKNLLIFLLSFFIFLSCNNSNKQTAEVIEPEEVEIIEPQYEYGIATDTLLVYKSTIADNEFLGNILTRHNVSYNVIDQISNSRSVFDVRRLQSGKPYCILSCKDSVARYFIYEPNAFEYVVFDFNNHENVVIKKEQRPVEIRERVSAGVIESSLYMTMKNNDADPALAIALSEIYAWTIDFYRIQKGDRYKVIYTEKYVEGQPVGIGNIKAAYFQHKNEDFYSFRFDQDGNPGYYNEEAKSLKKAFLQAPLKFSRITSRYSPNRLHPVLKTNRPHLGTDYAAPHGTPIMATGEGTIIEIGYNSGNGNYIKIKHNNTYTTQYLHMSKFASGMKKGTRVRQGETIGYVGSTGLATGPHVCYRFWKNGKQVDPFKEKTPHQEPVEQKNMDRFTEVKNEYKEKLKRINFNEDNKNVLSALE